MRIVTGTAGPRSSSPKVWEYHQAPDPSTGCQNSLAAFTHQDCPARLPPMKQNSFITPIAVRFCIATIHPYASLLTPQDGYIGIVSFDLLKTFMDSPDKAHGIKPVLMSHGSNPGGFTEIVRWPDPLTAVMVWRKQYTTDHVCAQFQVLTGGRHFVAVCKGQHFYTLGLSDDITVEHHPVSLPSHI